MEANRKKPRGAGVWLALKLVSFPDCLDAFGLHPFTPTVMVVNYNITAIAKRSEQINHWSSG